MKHRRAGIFSGVRIALCGVLVLALLAGSVRATGAQTSPVVRIGVVPGEFSAQPWYADEVGIFAKYGLKVQISPFTSGAAGAAALVSGAFDIIFTNVLSLAIAYQKGLPLTAIAVANIYSPKDWGSGVLAVDRGSPLNSAKSFAGKTIAVNALNNAMELGARAWIDKNGGDSSTVRWVEIPDFQQEGAVESGRVDAAVMSAGVYPKLGKPDYPIRVVAPALGAIAPTFAVDVWATSNDWLAQHPNEARAFVAAMREAAVWGNTHHHESAEILTKYTKRSLADIEASVRYIYGTDLTPQALQPQIDAAAKYGWLASFPAQRLITKVR